MKQIRMVVGAAAFDVVLQRRLRLGESERTEEKIGVDCEASSNEQPGSESAEGDTGLVSEGEYEEEVGTGVFLMEVHSHERNQVTPPECEPAEELIEVPVQVDTFVLKPDHFEERCTGPGNSDGDNTDDNASSSSDTESLEYEIVDV